MFLDAEARQQIERLGPIVADCDTHAGLAADVDSQKTAREALHAFFAEHKIALLDKRKAGLASGIAKLDERIGAQKERRRLADAERDGLKQSILENGGDRIAILQRDIEARSAMRQERMTRAESYGRIAKALGLAEPRDADMFVALRR